MTDRFGFSESKFFEDKFSKVSIRMRKLKYGVSIGT